MKINNKYTYSCLFSFFLFFVMDFTISSFQLIKFDNGIIYRDSDTGWYELEKNFTGYGVFLDKRYPVKTDVNGFRINDQGQEIKKKALANFVFLGDSHTYGINGPWNKTYVGMFAKSSKLKVANLGVPSYSPTVYFYQYQKLIKQKKLQDFHIVLLQINPGDVRDEALRWKYINNNNPIDRLNKKPSATTKYLKANFTVSLQLFRIARSFVSRAPKHTSNQVMNAPSYDFIHKDWQEVDKLYAPIGVKVSLEITAKMIKKIAQTVKINGGKFYILIHPQPAYLGRKVQDEVELFDWEKFSLDICKQSACSGVINTLPKFMKLAAKNPEWMKSYFLEGDSHYTIEGNRIVADEIQNYFR